MGHNFIWGCDRTEVGEGEVLGSEMLLENLHSVPSWFCFLEVLFAVSL